MLLRIVHNIIPFYQGWQALYVRKLGFHVCDKIMRTKLIRIKTYFWLTVDPGSAVFLTVGL